MDVSRVALIISYSLLFCFIHPPSFGEASAEDVPENNPESSEDTAQFHNKMSHERGHLLAHLADRMDLDGEGLRHIQKHLQEQTGDPAQNKDLKDVANGDNAKGIFYFFKFHDYDNNQKLDGLEWMQALTDFHQEDDSKGEFKEGGKVFLEHEAEAIVDELLTKHDRDDDGMIDFFELMNSKVDSLMTNLDKPHPGEQGEHDAGEQQQHNSEEQSSLEQEFNQHQQNQQDHSQQQQNQEQQEGDKQPQEDQQHNQQQQEDHQQQENDQHNSEETQGDKEISQEQHDSQKQNEPSSLEEEYNQQQQQS